MGKKSSNLKKVILSLVLSVAISEIGYANSLSQLDIARSASSDSSLDVTLYTSSAYSDNVAVTKKSDNKYVILMPNVASSQTGKPDFHGVRDFVSDIDVKSVNDGNGGYTKVTLTTTKPVNIRTKLKNSTPLSPEQKAYKSLITKSRTSPDTPVYIPDSRTYLSKTNLAVNKPTQPAKATSVVKPAPTKPVVDNNKVVKNTTQDKKITKSITPEPKVVPVKKIVNTNPENIKTTKTTALVDNKPVENNLTKDKVVKNEVVKNEVKTKQTNSNQIKNPTKTDKPKNNFPITLATILIPVLSLIFLLKMIKKSVSGSISLKHSFRENHTDKPVAVENYDSIVSDTNLNWQEKYKQFREKTNISKDENIDNNKVIKKFEVKKKPVKKPDIVMDKAVAELEKQINKLEIERDNKKMNKEEILTTTNNKQDIEKLEKILHDSPKVEKIEINEEDLMKSLDNEEVEVYVEDNSISSSMSEIKKIQSPKKFKGFANKIALEETSRTKPLPKKHDEIKDNKNIESKHIELSGNKLYSNTRDFKDANLRVADLISKSRKFIPNAAPNNNLKIENKSQKTIFGNDKGYSIVTPEEFFALPESNRATASSELSNKVANSLSKIKPSIKLQQKNDLNKINSSNPFKSSEKDSVFNGLIVKSGVNLDDKKGLYVVNLDGETALIGRIDNEVFVLKKFNKNIENPIQVRHDEANVYMVKADKYRSLVQINEDKMDVLVEL